MTACPQPELAFHPARAARRVGAIWIQELPTLARLGVVPAVLLALGMTLVLRAGFGSHLALAGALVECAGLALYATRVYRLVVLGEGPGARRAIRLNGPELRIFALLAGLPALAAVLFLVIVTGVFAASGPVEVPSALNLSILDGIGLAGAALALLIVLVRFAEWLALFVVDTAVTGRFRPVRMWRLSGQRILGFFLYNALVGAGLVTVLAVAAVAGLGLEAILPAAGSHGALGDAAVNAARFAMALVPLSLGLVASSVGYTEMVRAADNRTLQSSAA